MTAWMFPGQGSQQPAMANAIAECAELVSIGEGLVGPSLRWIATSPRSQVWPADLVQPAIYLTSVGASRTLRKLGARPEAVVGHSLGEFAALYTAGVLSFEEGLEVVVARGRAMMRAGGRAAGGMAAVVGLELTVIEEICESAGSVWLANLNSESQFVISGTDEGLVSAAAIVKERGGKAIRLQVPVAAHTPLMAPAADDVAKALDAVELRIPEFPFYSCVDASRHSDPAEIRQLLIDGVTRPVKFEATVRAMADAGITSFVETGPGKALAGLVKRILPDAPITGISSDEEAAEFAAATVPVGQGIA